MTAVISRCGQYRYTLERPEGGATGRLVLWVMVNPSTATADTNDATIRRCIAFTRDWRYDGLLVGNLYAFRSRHPKALKAAADPVGPDNDTHLAELARRATLIVCAWGQRGPQRHRPDAVRGILGRPVHALGFTQGGEPRHPLMLRADLRPEVW
jgi:hypothetical protein